MNPTRSLALLPWFLLLALALLPGGSQGAEVARLRKILPHFLDEQGRHTIAPSLYDRDAYQAELRRQPERRTGLRFDVQWKLRTRTPLQLRVELRGARDKQATTAVLSSPVTRTSWFSQWTSLRLDGPAYRELGELVAWKATLWDGEKLVSSLQSFLW